MCVSVCADVGSSVRIVGVSVWRRDALTRVRVINHGVYKAKSDFFRFFQLSTVYSRVTHSLVDV